MDYVAPVQSHVEIGIMAGSMRDAGGRVVS